MLHNSNIVSCVESFRHQGKLCIVMDYCSEGKQALKGHSASIPPLPHMLGLCKRTWPLQETCKER